MLKQLLSAQVRGVKSSPVRDLLEHSKTPDIISLAGGIPAPDLFDMEGIDSVMAELIAGEHRDVFQYGLTEGEADLRQRIAEWAAPGGVTAAWDSILITSGSQQGLDLIARVLLDRGDRVIVERPTYLAALQVFQFADARVEAVRGGPEGLDVDEVEAKLRQGGVKVIYLLPNFANPTGSTMRLESRVRLVALARRYEALIIEDDPYRQLRLSGEELPTLHSIAAQEPGGTENVIYLSTFSKIFSPGVRVAWLAMPSFLRPAAAVAKQALDLHTSTLSQRIVARYLETGRLSARIQVLRAAYRERRDALVSSLREALGDDLRFDTPDGGLFLWGRFAHGVPAAQVLRHGLEKRVVFVPGTSFYVDDPEHDTVRLSYSMLTPASAREGARRLKLAWDAARPS